MSTTADAILAQLMVKKEPTPASQSKIAVKLAAKPPDKVSLSTHVVDKRKQGNINRAELLVKIKGKSSINNKATTHT